MAFSDKKSHNLKRNGGENMREWLRGKKTYIIAGLAIIKIVYDIIIGDTTISDGILQILTASGVISLRAGIKNG
mgnify:CR=1 FL=1